MSLLSLAIVWGQGLYSPQDLAKSQSHEIPVALKFDRHLGSGAAEMLVKFQSDTIIIIPNLAASRLREIWWWDVLPLRE